MRRLVVVLALAVSCTAFFASGVGVAPADPGQVSVQRFMTDGDAESFFGGCDFLNPPGPLSCHETHVEVFKEGATGFTASTAPPKTPWEIFIDDYTVTFATGGPDAVPVFSDERTGLLVGPTVAFDEPHLSFLNVSAQVPMSDGSTFDFRGTWLATSDRLVFGNDGPTLDSMGLPRHYVDTCSTVNDQAHQIFRSANMSGELNGVPVQSYPDLGLDFIAHNHFIFIDVTHASC